MAEKLLINEQEKFEEMTDEWVALAKDGNLEKVYATRRGTQNEDGTYNSAYEDRFRFDCARGEEHAKKYAEVYNPLLNIFADDVDRTYVSHSKDAEKIIKAAIAVGKGDSIKDFEAIWALMCGLSGTYHPDKTNNYVNALENSTILIWLHSHGHISKKKLVLEFNKAMMMNTNFEWHIEKNGQNMFKKWRIDEKGL